MNFYMNTKKKKCLVDNFERTCNGWNNELCRLKFTLSAKSNIFSDISFSDADTLISIWHMNYLDIVHSSCLSSLSGGKIDNHLGETSQANDGIELDWNFTAQPSPFLHFSKTFWDLFVTPNTISASLLQHFLSWAWTTRPTDIWLILKSDHWTGCWFFGGEKVNHDQNPTVQHWKNFAL